MKKNPSNRAKNIFIAMAVITIIFLLTDYNKFEILASQDWNKFTSPLVGLSTLVLMISLIQILKIKNLKIPESNSTVQNDLHKVDLFRKVAIYIIIILFCVLTYFVGISLSGTSLLIFTYIVVLISMIILYRAFYQVFNISFSDKIEKTTPRIALIFTFLVLLGYTFMLIKFYLTIPEFESTGAKIGSFVGLFTIHIFLQLIILPTLIVKVYKKISN